MEKVYDVLKPRCQTTVAHMRDDRISSLGIKNIYAALPVEEPSEGFINYEPPPAQPVDAAKPVETNEVYTIEVLESLEAKCLAAQCLFEDIADLRQSVAKMWSAFEGKGVDLIPCALASNTAVDLVRKAQEDFTKEFGPETTYEDLAKLVYFPACFAQGIIPQHEVTRTKISASNPKLPYDSRVAGVAEYIMLGVRILLAAFEDVIKVNNAPILQGDYFGKYDASVDWWSLSPLGRFMSDTALLMRSLPDACWLTLNRGGVPAEDQLVRYCHHLRKGGKTEL